VAWAVLTLQTNQEQYRTKKRALKAFVPLVCINRQDILVAGSSLEL
jgi:hypothetical protein